MTTKILKKLIFDFFAYLNPRDWPAFVTNLRYSLVSSWITNVGLLKVDRKYFVWQWGYLVTAFNSIRLQSRHVFQCRKYSLFTALEFKSCYSPIAPRMSLLILRSICDGAPWPESEQKKPHQTKPFSPQKKEKNHDYRSFLSNYITSHWLQKTWHSGQIDTNCRFGKRCSTNSCAHSLHLLKTQ